MTQGMDKMQLHIAICDDERAEIDYLKMLISRWAEERGFAVQISRFESAESFWFAYEEDKSFDIILLDIQMKAMDGVELAKQIRKDNESLQIIFITGFPDFIAEVYDVSALHYLIKPVDGQKLVPVLDRAQKNLNRTEKSLLIAVDGGMCRIPFSEIRYVEAQGHYVLIHAAACTYKTKTNLSDVQATLDERFFRCQRSFIVNLQCIRKITRTAVVLDDLIEVPLSRDLYNAANQAVIRFFP
jgi:DNA-binding LytR/AlgR family response regulator